jgi:hypothetical protein
LVSFNVNPISGTLPITRVQDVLYSVAGGYDLVEYYDSTDAADPWKVYGPARPAYSNSLHTLRVGQGFWVHMLNEATWTLRGTPVTSLSIPLYVGWNMVGWPVRTDRTLPGALNGIAGKYVSVWAYPGGDADPPWRHYAPAAAPWANNLGQMEPGKGYWLEVTQNCTLTVVQ